MPAILAKKLGMTQRFLEDGRVERVTVLEAGPCPVLAIRTHDADGYEAVQLGYGAIREKRLTKPQIGRFKKLGIGQRRHLREIRGPAGEFKVGEELKCDRFEAGTLVDVIGTSKGKGFQGTIKLHNFSRGPEAHGSDNVRKPGSIGMHTHPGRTLKGKKMASMMGNKRVTVRRLEVVSVDAEAGVVLIKGAVPGNNGGLILLRKSQLQKTRVQA